jgi:hypothetical protein
LEEPSWPEEAELFQLVKGMLTGGTGVPAAPIARFEPAKATYVLLDRVKTVVKKLKDDHGAELHMVPGTNGRIDQQETRGYLLGAVLGSGLLTREQAKDAGLDARNKLTALEKRLATQKELARKAAIAARKAGGDAPATHAAAALKERRKIELEQINLNLPPPPRAAPARLPPAKPTPAVTCGPVQTIVQTMVQTHFAWYKAVLGIDTQKRQRLSRALAVRAQMPRTYAERKKRAQTLTRQQRHNRVCECDDDVPSILCKEYRCYAYEIGMCDGGGLSDRVECTCMRYAFGGVDGEHERYNSLIRHPLLWDLEEASNGHVGLAFRWLSPMGGRGLPPWDVCTAARKLTVEDVRLADMRASAGHDPNAECPELDKFPSYGRL